MKTNAILSNITEEMNNVKELQENSIAQKNELEKRAENYANNILLYVHRRELCAEYCGGYYAY